MNFSTLLREHHGLEQRVSKLEKEVKKMNLDITPLINAASSIAQSVTDAVNEIQVLVTNAGTTVDPATVAKITSITDALSQEAAALEAAVKAAQGGVATKVPGTVGPVVSTSSAKTLAPTTLSATTAPPSTKK